MRGSASVDLAGATTTNLIRPDGHIAGLAIGSGQLMVIGNYDDVWNHQRAIPVVVEDFFGAAADGALELEFDADAWGSTISFETGIPVLLGGRLELSFAEGVHLASQVGRTLKLFDWSGVSPVGEFTVVSPHAWDLSKLYVDGSISLVEPAPQPGDFDGDGDADGADFLAWQRGATTPPFDVTNLATWKKNFGASPQYPGDFNDDFIVDGSDFLLWQRQLGESVQRFAGADASGDGRIDGEDLELWRLHFVAATTDGAIAGTAIPEPQSAILFAIAGMAIRSVSGRRKTIQAACWRISRS
jgi:hypothetical protein